MGMVVAMDMAIMAKDQLMHHPNHTDTVDTTVAMEDMVITDMVVAMDMAIMAKDQLRHHLNHTDMVDTTVAMEDMAITVMVAMEDIIMARGLLRKLPKMMTMPLTQKQSSWKASRSKMSLISPTSL